MKIYRKFEDIEFTIVYDEEELSELQAMRAVVFELGKIIRK